MGDVPLAFLLVTSYSLMLYLKDSFPKLWFSVCAGAEVQWPGKAVTVGFLLASHSAVALMLEPTQVTYATFVRLSLWLIPCSDGH